MVALVKVRAATIDARLLTVGGLVLITIGNKTAGCYKGQKVGVLTNYTLKNLLMDVRDKLLLKHIL
ncbi:hypothetical protein M8C21_033035, partial [Ambrosia artemisiifolia]